MNETPTDLLLCLSLQGLAIPMGQICPCLIGALDKIQEHLFGRVCVPNIVVAQEELRYFGAVKGRTGTNRRVF